ncbi:DUF503 domain-containing protein [Glycomyces xiaoerkulensis]|uniref:DUF503 domain-containing protein n=1 Tax=Glycomyces xiaoerkulensis TaxID=2038139 RepID=UPI000C2691BD|nr:DUF503 domain-containing protein [Glycomyces xiaoerkulensis]
MFTGCVEFDVLLPEDSRSLKAKRSYVRPIVASLRRFEVAAAEVGDQELYGRATVGAAAVAGDNPHVQEVLNACEQHMAGRPEVELISVRRRVFGPEDE